MATVQYTSISNSSYLGKANALPFCVKQLPNFFALDNGRDLIHGEVCGGWSISLLSIGLWFVTHVCTVPSEGMAG